MRLTHEEYRKLLKSKVSLLTECNNKLESLKSATSTKIRELEYALTQATKTKETVAAENRQLYERVCLMQVEEVKKDRMLLDKEEELEQAQQ